jgi:hypothetical protein
MNQSRFPNDPYQHDDPDRFPQRREEFQRRELLDEPAMHFTDPEEERVGSGRIAIIAVAAIVMIGALFYGLNTSTSTPPTTATDTTTSSGTVGSSPPPSDSGIRDVTPSRESTTEQGGTTIAPMNRDSAPPAQITPPAQNPDTGSGTSQD